MRVEPVDAISEEARLGADRVLEPAGALPQPAARLDPSGPVRPHEFELEVERLCLDATSHAAIRRDCAGDPGAMAARVLEIAAARGKMHNPATDSGGVAVGTVSAVGASRTDAPAIGERVVTLASLTLTPLELDEITRLDPASAQIDVRGRAYVTPSAPWNSLPNDIDLETAVAIYDVYGAASHTRRLAPEGGTVAVLGTGHAGKLALAAAREATGPSGTLIAVDRDIGSLAAVAGSGLADVVVEADLRTPIAARSALAAAGGSEADLVVVVVSAAGCEAASILLAREGGTVLFFSMATSFQTAALTADGMGRDVRMLVGSGFTPDVGDYALDLYRRTPALREAFAQ